MENKLKVLENSELGRYVIASQNLKKGEILYEEIPFVVGPKFGSPPLCLECCAFIDGSGNGPKCPKCNWPLCEECASKINSLKYHTKECNLFLKQNMKFKCVEESSESCSQLDFITPLRLLLEKEANEERWENEVALMEDHENERKSTNEWMIDEKNIVKLLKEYGIKFSSELIHRAIGILEVNAFEARTVGGYSVRCLFPKLAIHSHSCIPNVSHSIFPSDGFRMKARVTVDVDKGEMLNTCYTYTLNGTMARQVALKKGKYFNCLCKRCLDPTELNTHFSSLKCQKCDNGVIISSDPLDINASWKCTHCEFKTSGHAIQKAILMMQSDLNELLYMEPSAEKLEALEQLFKKYKSVLHPRHFVMLAIKYALIELYGRVPGYELDDLPDVLLERKENLCRDILKVLDTVEPGMSRSRAMTLYELHAPVLLMTRTAYAAGILSGKLLKKKMEEVIGILQECISILQFEDTNTSEGILCQVAEQALVQLKESCTRIEE